MRGFVIGAAVLVIGLGIAPGDVTAQARLAPVGSPMRLDPTPLPPGPAPAGAGFGSVPSFTQEIRVETQDGRGGTRDTRIMIGEGTRTGGSAGGRSTGFGSVPVFDREIRIRTDGPATVTPIIILPAR